MSHLSISPSLNKARGAALTLALALGLLSSLPGPGRAADGKIVLPGAGSAAPAQQGIIPGTHMTHDEFRARAYAQLGAVALNAHAYYAVSSSYPATYYDLFNSDAWNLDVKNIFTGQPVDAIEFTPQTGDFTTTPPVLFQMPGTASKEDFTEANTPPVELNDSNPQDFQKGIVGLGKDMGSASKSGGTRRVNPDHVNPQTPGSIFYYANGKLLQLVMFASDGTYVEFVAETPNAGWLNLLNIQTSGGRSFPSDLFANQVLLYLERILPRHYNLVRFMSSTEPVAENDLQQRSAEQRIQMAHDLGVIVSNPYSKQPAKVAQGTPKAGEFAPADPAHPGNLAIALRSGEVVTFDKLSAGIGPAGSAPQPGGRPAPPRQPVKPNNPPPMGGRDAR